MVAAMIARRTSRWICASLLVAALVGCGKKKEQAEGGASAPLDSAGDKAGEPTVSPASGESKALAPTPTTAGLSWKRITMPFGSLELPADPGWNLVGTDVQGPDDLVIMLQAQDGVSPAQQRSYLKQYGKLQARDAHGYRAKAELGELGGAPAIRIEGSFDNGTKYVTREYLVFAKGKVVALAAHIPAIHGDKLAGIIDPIARSLQVE